MRMINAKIFLALIPYTHLFEFFAFQSSQNASFSFDCSCLIYPKLFNLYLGHLGRLLTVCLLTVFSQIPVATILLPKFEEFFLPKPEE